MSHHPDNNPIKARFINKISPFVNKYRDLSNPHTRYISGGLGNQLLRYSMTLAEIIETDININRVCVTKYPPFIKGLIEAKTLPITNVSIPAKNDVDHNDPENVRRLFRNRDELVGNDISFQKDDVGKFDICIHARGTDKKMLNYQDYKEIIESIHADSSLCIVTDDDDFRSEFEMDYSGCPNIHISEKDMFQDWLKIYNAEVVYSTASSFSLSTLIFDPSKEINIIIPKSPNQGTETVFVQESMEYCDNLELQVQDT
jgi:hypothetical protein